MANRMIEGFDAIATADLVKRFNTVGASTTVTANGRNSGSCARSTSWTGGSLLKTLDTQATWVVGFAFKLAALPTGNKEIITFIDPNGSTIHVNFQITTGGAILAYRGTGAGTLLATSTTSLSTGVWYYLEFKVTISDTVGVIAMQINGVAETFTFVTGTSTTQDTRNSNTAGAASIQWFGSSGGALGGTLDVDDVYINDGSGGVDDDYWGDIRVVTKSVDGAGNAAQFTPSASTNQSNVDDATPDGDTTYNESSTVNHIDSMTTAALGVTGTVKGVEVLAYARKTDAGVATLAPHWRIASTNYAGTGQGLSVDYQYVAQRYRVSPNTSAAWTTSELDGAELGYKRTA